MNLPGEWLGYDRKAPGHGCLGSYRIELRDLEGLPHEEVAQRMGRGVWAARMLWVRALARLRKEMEQG